MTRPSLTVLLIVSLAALPALAQETPPVQPEPSAPATAPEPEATPEEQPAETDDNAEMQPPATPAETAEPPATPSEPTPPAPPAAEPAVTTTEETSVPATEVTDDPPMFVVAPHIGLLVPQLFAEFGSWPVFGLELGLILPFDVAQMRRPLQVSFDVMYTQPGAKGTQTSDALGDAGQEFEWQLKERTLVLELSGLWRFMPPGQDLSAFATLGPRLYLMESIMQASSAGQDFGENRETKTQVGFVVGGGAEYAVGPGSVFGALELAWSDVKQRITGDSNNGALVLDVGYRLMF